MLAPTLDCAAFLAERSHKTGQFHFYLPRRASAFEAVLMYLQGELLCAPLELCPQAWEAEVSPRVYAHVRARVCLARHSTVRPPPPSPSPSPSSTPPRTHAQPRMCLIVSSPADIGAHAGSAYGCHSCACSAPRHATRRGMALPASLLRPSVRRLQALLVQAPGGTHVSEPGAARQACHRGVCAPAACCPTGSADA